MSIKNTIKRRAIAIATIMFMLIGLLPANMSLAKETTTTEAVTETVATQEVETTDAAASEDVTSETSEGQVSDEAGEQTDETGVDKDAVVEDDGISVLPIITDPEGEDASKERTGEEIFKLLTSMDAPESSIKDSKQHPYGYGDGPILAISKPEIYFYSSSSESLAPEEAEEASEEATEATDETTASEETSEQADQSEASEATTEEAEPTDESQATDETAASEEATEEGDTTEEGDATEATEAESEEPEIPTRDINAWLKGFKGEGSFLSLDSYEESGKLEGGAADDSQSWHKASYMQAVPFDPTGCGRNNFVAFVGMNKSEDSNAIEFWVLDTENEKISEVTTIDGAAWTKDALVDAEMYARNFLSITAGDYNGDGKDSVIVYAPASAEAGIETQNLFEIAVTSSEEELTCTVAQRGWQILHNEYLTSELCREDNTDITDKLQCSLATGDINNDSIDDLIAISSIGGKAEGSEKLHQAYIGAAFGKDDESFIIVNKSDMGTYVDFDGATIKSAGIDAGDVDGDNAAEIIVAGYQYQDAYDTGATVMAKYSLEENELTNESNQVIETPYYFAKNSTELLPSRTSVICFAPSGKGAAQQVFVNGDVYEGTSGEMIKAYHDTRFDVGSSDLAEEPTAIMNAYAGNFDGNDYGFEQVMYSLEQHKQAEEDANVTVHGVLLKGEGAAYSDTGYLAKVNQYQSIQAEPYEVAAESNGGKSETINMFMIPVEKKADDGVMVKLNESGYYYSNPQPVAALQAAPYFDGMNTAVGETTYEITSSMTTGDPDSYRNAIGGGIADDVKTGVAAESFAKVYQEMITPAVIGSINTSKVNELAATDKDTVVMQMLPAEYYSYDVLDPESGEWQKNSVGITVARDPVYEQITVGEYNAFVEYYNEWIDNNASDNKDAKLKKVHWEDLGLGNAGNPGQYAKLSEDMSDYPGWKQISASEYTLEYEKGQQSSNYAEELGQSSTDIQSWEVAAGIAATTGEDGFNKYADLWAKDASVSKVATTTDGNLVSGNVTNIEAKPAGVAANVEDYGFQWVMGESTVDVRKAKDDEATAADKMTVLGYALKDVKAGLPIPAIKSATKIENNNVLVTWDEVKAAEGQEITGYKVYEVDIDGTVNAMTEEPLAADVLQYEFDKGDKEFAAFMVTAVGTVEGSTETHESVPCAKDAMFFVKEEEEPAADETAEATEATEATETTDETTTAEATDETEVTDESATEETTTEAATEATEEETEVVDETEEEAEAVTEEGILVTSDEAYEMAKEAGFTGTQVEWITFITGIEPEEVTEEAEETTDEELAEEEADATEPTDETAVTTEDASSETTEAGTSATTSETTAAKTETSASATSKATTKAQESAAASTQ
ncbi:MAG: hypothetical protein KBS66_06460, partial [Eubacterium sp.]|nr:hypothetical protein [Candidatus Colimonas fimequi]